MAVVNQPYSSSLKLRYQNGVNASGDPIYITSTYSKARVNANDQDLYDVATAINGLQDITLVSVFRADDSELINE